MKKIEVTVVDYHEFDKLVRETWPQKAKYECVAEYEWGNDTDHLCENVKQMEDGRVQYLEKWLRGEKYSCIGEYQVLEALVRAGKLEPGNYCISVYW